MCFDVNYVTVSVLSCSINHKSYQFDRSTFRYRNQISFFPFLYDRYSDLSDNNRNILRKKIYISFNNFNLALITC